MNGRPRRAVSLALAAALLAPPRAFGDEPAAGLVLYNGRIFIAPGRYAEAVAVEGRRVAAVGGSEALLARARPGTRRIDLSGRAVVPGFHDAHVHFLEGALQDNPGDPGKAMEKALGLARSVGVTSLSGPFGGDARPELEFWTAMHRQGKATLRCWLWGNLDAPSDFLAAREQYSASLPPERFHWSGLKGRVDGDFDPWTAALLEPYGDRPQSRGRMRYAPTELKDLVARGRETGLAVHLHAIGDRAVRAALGACASFMGKNPKAGAGEVPAPCVIEHADLTSKPDLERLAALGIVVSVQPSRKSAPGADVVHPRRLGPRGARTFAVRSLQAAGVPLAFGSDWPVMPLDPLLGLHAAASGGPAEERISMEEAIVHYTAGPARAAGAGRELGLIQPGYLADLVVFDRDLLSLSGADILEARVDATIFDGKVVYSRVDARGF